MLLIRGRQATQIKGTDRRKMTMFQSPVEDRDSFCVVMATKQIVHIVVEHSKAKLQNGFDSIIKEAIDNIHSTLNWQDTDKESQEP